MRGFLASFYKDMKLMMNGTGMFTLLLSAVLMPVFLYGTRDLSVENTVRPFPVAVRDLDKTFMSRALISQMREIELFEEVRQADESVSDRDLTAAGCVAVITIPHDFFYAMYSASESPVAITLNENKPLEASLVRSVITSVLDIITADQAALYGAYRFVYGEPDGELLETLYAETSRDILADALGRQRVFSTEMTVSDITGVMRRRLTSVLLPMLAVLFASAAFTTLPQERDMGVLSRLRACGVSGISFALSKVLTAMLWVMPLTAVLYVLSGLSRLGAFLLPVLSVLFVSFCTVLAIVSWMPDESDAKRCCNLYLLLSLFFGGTLLTEGRLKEPLALLQFLFPGRFVFSACNAIASGEAVSRVCIRLIPVLITGCVSALLAVCGTVKSTRMKRNRTETRERAGGKAAGTDARLLPVPVRLLRIVLMKIPVYAGNSVSLFLICLISLLCGASCSVSPLTAPESVTVAVTDGDRSEKSGELLTLLKEKSGDRLHWVICDTKEKDRLLTDGLAEGGLTIPEGYGTALERDAKVLLEYKSSAASFSAQSVREMIAGQVAVQRAGIRGIREAERLCGHALSGEETRRLSDLIRAEAVRLPAMSGITGEKGANGTDPFSPGRISYLAMQQVLLMMTFAAYTGRRDAASVERRLNVTRTGALLTYGADVLALSFTGCLTAVCFLIPGGVVSAPEAAAVLMMTVCVAAFSLMLTRLTAQAGRVDALAPVLTLLICLLGGCFLDLSVLSGSMVRLMSVSPAGAGLMAAGGLTGAFFVLAGETAVCLLLGMRRRYGSGH